MIQTLMVVLQTVSLMFALYFTTTMFHNWIVVCNPRFETKLPQGGFYNTSGRFASFFWGLFYLCCQS